MSGSNSKRISSRTPSPNHPHHHSTIESGLEQLNHTMMNMVLNSTTFLNEDGGMGNKASHSESEEPTSFLAAASSTKQRPGSSSAHKTSTGSHSHIEGHAEDGDDGPMVDVPPPMQPISTNMPNLVNNSSGLNADGQVANSSSSDTKQSCDDNDKAGGDSQADADAVAGALEQRGYRLQELLESEKTYIQDLSQAMAYIHFMRESKEREAKASASNESGEVVDLPEDHLLMPNDLKEGKDRMIFGNIEAIYEWHRDFFSKNLEKSIANPTELGNLFKRYDRKFQMYVVYCQNKPKSEFIVSEYGDNYLEDIRLKLGFKLRLQDLLIKPIQRLTKYHILLEAILKYSQRAGLQEEADAIAKAFHVMTIVPDQANDMMDIGRLQGFEGKITAQGKLLQRGPLTCVDNFSQPQDRKPPKTKTFTVFLFEQIMIFSEAERMAGKNPLYSSPTYTYKTHFLVNKMALDERADDGDPLKFVIRSNDPAREELKIVCGAESVEMKVKWMDTLKRQLQTMNDFLRALQAPIAYHNKLAKDS